MKMIPRPNNVFLFNFWGTKKFRKNSSQMSAVKHAMHDKIDELYLLGQSGFLVSTTATFNEIESLLPSFKDNPYLLIDVTEPVKKGHMKGFLPSLNIDAMIELTEDYKELRVDNILDKINEGLELSKVERKFLDDRKNS